jgi:hydrogenase/urease accessory protein HupE
MKRGLALSWMLLAALVQADAGLAHELRPGFLELREKAPGTYALLWKRPVGGETAIDLVPLLPEGCELAAPGPAASTPGAVLVHGELRCAGGLAGKIITIGGLESTYTDVVIRVEHADGRVESHLAKPVAPSVALGTAMSAWHRSVHYARLGVEHILLGVDHLLFVLGLLLLVDDRWTLVKTITAFTIAHSVTLAAATLGYAAAPLPPLNAVIALSILFLGPEILRRERGGTSLTIRHPWAVAFAFGLLHGFGFATGLTAMGLPAGEVPLALLLFNVGVEAGQLAFVAIIVALERSFYALEIVWARPLTMVPAYAIGSLGAYWTIGRTVAMARVMLGAAP